MTGRTGGMLLLAVIVTASTPLFAQQTVARGTHATIQCESQSYVPVTADEDQGIPLQLVDKAACGSEVTILSDPQGYTVKVRTAAGRIGYVARYQIAIESAPKVSPPSNSADDKRAAAAAAVIRSDLQSSESGREASSSSEERGPRKPRVYVSDTASWNASGGFSRASSIAPDALYGGYDPDLTDIYQDFTSGCSAITVTQKKADADFVVLFDKGTPKKGFKGLHGLVKVNKVTVLSKSGETLLSETERSSDVAVTAACNAVSQPPGKPASNADGQSPR